MTPPRRPTHPHWRHSTYQALESLRCQVQRSELVEACSRSFPNAIGSRSSWFAFLMGSMSKPFSFGLVRRIVMECIADDTIICFLARQTKARIIGWPVHYERESDSLTALAAIVSAHPNIMMRVGSASRL